MRLQLHSFACCVLLAGLPVSHAGPCKPTTTTLSLPVSATTAPASHGFSSSITSATVALSATADTQSSSATFMPVSSTVSTDTASKTASVDTSSYSSTATASATSSEPLTATSTATSTTGTSGAASTTENTTAASTTGTTSTASTTGTTTTTSGTASVSSTTLVTSSLASTSVSTSASTQGSTTTTTTTAGVPTQTYVNLAIYRPGGERDPLYFMNDVTAWDILNTQSTNTQIQLSFTTQGNLSPVTMHVAGQGSAILAGYPNEGLSYLQSYSPSSIDANPDLAPFECTYSPSGSNEFISCVLGEAQTNVAFYTDGGAVVYTSYDASFMQASGYLLAPLALETYVY